MDALDLPTPFVAVDRQVMVANIARMAKHATSLGMALRPHAKTHKSAAIARRQLEAGAVGLTVATISQARAFARFGFDDLFIAFPLWIDHDRSHSLGHLLEDATVRVGLDSVEAVGPLAQFAGERLSVAVEVDSGHHRSGVAPDRAGHVAAAAADAGLEVAGVFSFPGHSYAPGAGPEIARQEAAALATAAESLRERGIESAVVSGGSTPSVAATSGGVLNEIRPGVYVFGDAQQWELGTCTPDQIALTVHATVVSHAGGRLVLDSGSTVLGSDRAPWASGNGRLIDYPDARIVLLSEHHAVAELPGPLPALGSRVRVVPNHVCVCVNNVDTLVVMDGGEPGDNWPVIARGAIT